jgi:hypothetical protein
LLSVGIALMGLEKKDRVIDVFNTIGQSLIRITNIIVGLTPVGVFAITAAEAGTMSLEEFGRLQVDLATSNISAIFLAFWVLPMMLGSLTPFNYRDVIDLTRDALVTAFATQVYQGQSHRQHAVHGLPGTPPSFKFRGGGGPGGGSGPYRPRTDHPVQQTTCRIQGGQFDTLYNHRT